MHLALPRSIRTVGLAVFCVLAVTPILHAQTSVLINEIDADTRGDDWVEFVELWCTPNQSLDGYFPVFFNGNGDVSYLSFNLNGHSLNESSYLVFGNAAVDPPADIVFRDNALQNGAGEVVFHSSQRCPDGGGGERITTEYVQGAPTPGAITTAVCTGHFSDMGQDQGLLPVGTL